MQTIIYIDLVPDDDLGDGTMAKAQQISGGPGGIIMYPPKATGTFIDELERWEKAMKQAWGHNYGLPLAAPKCTHEPVDTGMRKTWCKRCNCSGEFKLGTVIWKEPDQC